VRDATAVNEANREDVVRELVRHFEHERERLVGEYESAEGAAKREVSARVVEVEKRLWALSAV
jgi:hypothetical protein